MPTTSPRVTRCPTRWRRLPGGLHSSASSRPRRRACWTSARGRARCHSSRAEMGHVVTGLDLSKGMLERAERKASERGLVIDFVVGPAEEPPLGAFDAVMARHLLWTLPAPAEALAAWRRAVRDGGRSGPLRGLVGGRRAVGWSDGRDRLLGGTADGRARRPSRSLSAGVIDRLPLQGASSPAPFVEAVRSAGWSRIRLVRLRDVEWSIERRAPWPLGRLRRRPRYAIVAESQDPSSR